MNQADMPCGCMVNIVAENKDKTLILREAAEPSGYWSEQ